MKPFLQIVANDLFQKIGHDLSRTAIVFPNKRAGLFFNEYLASQSEQPIWSPAYLTINELFTSAPVAIRLLTGDTITLVCELYQVFLEETGRNESLDDFYFWGELLISDFDDVDKNMVDADRLYSNLQELHALSQGSDFLEPEQQEAIREFFANFSPERRTLLKERFISLWDKMLPIYHRFRERLAAKGIAYEGMMEREVLSRLEVDQLPYERYVFVGFNVLNRVEHSLFTRLMEAGKALFYWDYDLYYTQMPTQRQPPYIHEAGEFILRNLKDFPNELSQEHFDVMRGEKEMVMVESPTENAQARYLTEWLRQLYSTREEHPFKEKENAVVLCNESLLLPVLHSIPEEVKNVNITMGFPLAQTPVYSFIHALCQLQTVGYQSESGSYLFEQVKAVLSHPYLRALSPQTEGLLNELKERNRFFPLPSELQRDEMLTQLFTPVSGIAPLCHYLMEALKRVAALYRQPAEASDLYGQLYRESLFKGYTLVGRLYTLATEQAFGTLRPYTFQRLLARLLNMATIPFHGEPAIGMQVMGVLETRNLDFRNLLMLSVNEGKLPKSESDSSFIPYNLRKAFGMTTIEHKNSVYAYYFYRLIQRAERVTMVYNSSTDGLNRGEMSRFMLQLLVEAPQPIRRYTLQAGQAPAKAKQRFVLKTSELMERLRWEFDKQGKGHILSPSALNAYLTCRMKFYYRYVAGIAAAPEVSNEIDSQMFGLIFHRSAQLIYIDLTAHGKMIQREELKQLLDDNARLQRYVDQAFQELFFQSKEGERPVYNGLQLINSKVIVGYLRQLLRHDYNYAPFAMEAMEKRITEDITIDTPLGPLHLVIGGTVDRMDRKDDTLRIVDYKTGGTPVSARDIEQLFTPDEKRPGYIFQACLYSALMCRRASGKVSPALLYIHKAAKEGYSPVITLGARSQKEAVEDFALYEPEFRQYLTSLLEEIFNPKVPFDQTEMVHHCEYCDFASLCGKR